MVRSLTQAERDKNTFFTDSDDYRKPGDIDRWYNYPDPIRYNCLTAIGLGRNKWKKNRFGCIFTAV
ncbi:hypothetical protein GCM10028803_40760 [Larkinella knui]